MKKQLESESETPYQISTRRNEDGDFEDVDIPITPVSAVPVVYKTFDSASQRSPVELIKEAKESLKTLEQEYEEVGFMGSNSNPVSALNLKAITMN